MTERTPFEAGLSRTSPPGPLPTESEPALLARIRAEIAADGPLTFERFMTIALYDPDHGYYRGQTDRPGRAGDFLTAPETHPIFGAAVGRQLDAVWRQLGRPDPFVLREYGPGSGTLAATILGGLRGDRSELAEALAYEPVEINAHRRAEIGARLAPLGLAVTEMPSTRFVGAVVANEFLDALPVHRVEGRAGRLLERFVDWEPSAGILLERAGEPSTPALADRLGRDGVVLAEGQVAEVCLGLEPWVRTVAAGLARGLVLVIDYGHPASVLYDPARIGGTLRAYAGQRAHADPFIAIGRQDLTAHVDLTALADLAIDHGLDRMVDLSQAEFLIACGLEELLERIRANQATSIEEWLAVRSAVARLLDPAALGAFRAVLLGRDLGPGFSAGTPRPGRQQPGCVPD